MTSFVVTTSVFGSSRTQIWDPARPLALGHPFQWVLEKTVKGLRVRDIAQARPDVISQGLKEISEAQLLHGAEFELGGKSPVSLKIRPVLAIEPAFKNHQGTQLTLYACAGDWVCSSTPLLMGEKLEEKLAKNPAFTAQRNAESILLSSRCANLVVSNRAGKNLLEKGQNLEISLADALETTLHYGGRTWRFSLSNAPVLSETATPVHDDEYRVFILSLRYAFIGVATLVALSWIWPKPKDDPKELIPAQFTKIVMSKPKAANPSTSQQAKQAIPAAAANAPKKVQEAAVVQAFRAKALNNAVSGLLKGGMSKLLAQSDFVAGNAASKDARRIFDSKSNALKVDGPDAGSMTNKNVQVAALGGAAGANNAVGYSKGEHAAVKGQGGNFVTMDTGGSSVEEGLTKDEVGEVIHRHLSEVRYCYESAMIRTPDIQGKLMVNFTIGGNGVVKAAEAKSSSLPDARLDDCIIRRLMTWKFPLPRGGIDVAVTYPFIFKTLGR